MRGKTVTTIKFKYLGTKFEIWKKKILKLFMKNDKNIYQLFHLFD